MIFPWVYLGSFLILFVLVTQCPPVGFSRRLLLRALPLVSAVKKKGRDSQSIMLTQKIHPGLFLSYVDYKSISVCSQRSWTFVIFTSFLVLNIDIILHLYIYLSSSIFLTSHPQLWCVIVQLNIFLTLHCQLPRQWSHDNSPPNSCPICWSLFFGLLACSPTEIHAGRHRSEIYRTSGGMEVRDEIGLLPANVRLQKRGTKG